MLIGKWVLTFWTSLPSPPSELAAASSTVMSVTYQSTRHHIAEGLSIFINAAVSNSYLA